MADDLDLSGIDRRYTPDAGFRAELDQRLAAIVAGTEPVDQLIETDSTVMVDLTRSAGDAPAAKLRRGRTARHIVALTAAAAVTLLVLVVYPRGERMFNSQQVSNGWITFAVYHTSADSGIYLVREGGVPRRVAGSLHDFKKRLCPALSTNGQRLAYGQATPTALVIADVSADGSLSNETTVAVDDTRPPCGIWSPDGRWIAFGVGDTKNHSQTVPTVNGVEVVDTATGAVRELPSGSPVSDLDWSPDGKELAVADGGIAIYSIATGEIRHLIDKTQVLTLDWSPDGRHIAFERHARDAGSRELGIVDADGTGERMIVPEYMSDTSGPVWSPDGTRIVYQRLCGQSCASRQTDEAVVATLYDSDGRPADFTQHVIPRPLTKYADSTARWSTLTVTWSPDGKSLLYHAWGGNGIRICPPGESCLALVAVPADGNGPAVVLSGDLQIDWDWVPGAHAQSWAPQPKG